MRVFVNIYRGNIACGRQQDCLHIDVWNYMVDETPKEKFKKINKVKDPKGLKQFVFDLTNNKSASSMSSEMNSNHKLIGSVEIPLCDIPAAGLDKWWVLEKNETKVILCNMYLMKQKSFIRCLVILNIEIPNFY